MPEGHTVHRTANQFNRLFAGQKVSINSPQGRFRSGAKLINGSVLHNARAIGKQLFLEFENGRCLRIHLGIYGKWAFSTFETKNPPAPIGEVRARFMVGNQLADLRGPAVCEVINSDEVFAVENRLGPDPLHSDPKGVQQQRFIDRVSGSKTAIGLLLMNQEVVSGIGNVYRAELLFRAGINPHTPGNHISEEKLVELWRDARDLLKVGVKTGFMITRDELRTKNPSKEDRNYIYKREGQPCRRCGTNISIELMAGRKLYWCVGCQN
jgi:DNA-formamidopyrimidine glycosylase